MTPTREQNRSSRSERSESIVQSHARQINGLPDEQREILLAALREGTRPAAIAHFFAEQGWLTVKQGTFVQYIQAFKRIYPDQARGTPDEQHLDHYVSPHQPGLDPEQHLEQLMRLQRLRLGIGVQFEKNTGIINHNLHKDINTSADLAEKLAKMRGGYAGAGRPNTDNVAVSAEAKETLRKNDSSEQAQSKLTQLTDKLGSLLAQRESEKNEAQT